MSTFSELDRVHIRKCSVENCDRDYMAKGFCRAHYTRVRRNGTVGTAPIDSNPKFCHIEECQREVTRFGLCFKHAQRLEKFGTTDLPERKYKGERINSSGYKEILVKGRGYIAEHRVVVENSIGRELTSEESIHHKNGNKLDNRLENLELWNRYQPAGQRVEDKLSWAREIISTYDKPKKPSYWEMW